LHRTVGASSAVHAIVLQWSKVGGLPRLASGASPFWRCHPDERHRRPGFFDPAENREDHDLRLGFEGDAAVGRDGGWPLCKSGGTTGLEDAGKTVVEGSLLDHLDRFLLDHPDGSLLDQVVVRGNQTG
jgi:hypothetical protein